MIVYLFNDNFFSKVFLPIKINGVYTLHSLNDEFLANIEEIDGKWHIMDNEDIICNVNGNDYINPEIGYYYSGLIKHITDNKEYNFYVLPIYDSEVYKVNAAKTEIYIGSSSNNDIIYNNEKIGDGVITIKVENNSWILETDISNVYAFNKEVKKVKLYNGDYIFFWGLKIFIVNNTFVINNPNELVTLNMNSFNNILLTNNSEEVLKSIPDDLPLFLPQDYFLKSPRFTSIFKTEKVKIDEPPSPIEKNNTPVILTIGPQLTMVSTSVLTMITYINSYMDGSATKQRFIISLATIGITILGALLWPTLTRIFNNWSVKKQEKKRQKKYKEYLQSKKQIILTIKSKQKQIMLENSISLENCKIIIDSRARNLWERTIEQEDFLSIRLGIGTVPTKIEVNDPSDNFTIEDKDALLTDLEDVVAQSKFLDKAPLTINLTEKNITAMVGVEKIVNKFVDSLFLQLMTFHSYTELKIVVFTNELNSDNYAYMKILPHCWDNRKMIRYYATNVEEMVIISQNLEKIFDERMETVNASKQDEEEIEKEKNIFRKYKPYYLIFTDNVSDMRNIPILKKILDKKVNIGFSLLMYNSRLNSLPRETSTFINVDEHISGLIGNELIIDNQKQFETEINSTVDIYECAQKLANIPIQLEKEKYELASSISFLEMYNVGKVEQLNCLDRWQTANPVNSLSVPVGIDQNGELFKMDIHEKAYGPHGLVAGTTGSGKSEWIITYILSLAINFRPDIVQFVLIDYKGGGLAMSFENSELGIKLPHLAGTITNLDKSAINRSISSIESELKRRQKIFNDAREKLKEGSMNIYKYQQFYLKGMVSEPLSHLFIICDEFAELKQQQPEFMEQLISTSRIGRSLGVHLILATQKPSGVVNDQIWSNSRFKACFRVQDKGDSQEILKKPDAAYLKQVGAFYLMVGNDEYYNMGQSAWAGAKYTPTDVLKKKIDQTVQYIDNIGRTINYYDDEEQKKVIKEGQGEELLNIIMYLDKLNKNENYTSKQLWLPNIEPVIYLSNIIKKFNHKAELLNFNTVIGEYDEPRRQEQNILKIDLSKGNIAIIGQLGAGKEKLISTIIWSSITEHTPMEINYYILDFGAETLKIFSKFPHVGEVVFQGELDKVAGIIDLIMSEMDRRKNLLVDYNGDFDYYNRKSGSVLPLIVLVINSFDIFSENIPKLADALTTLFRDAPRYGVIFLISASSPTAIRTRQLQYFNHIIVMQLQDESMYRTITNCRRGLIPSRSVGRGICKTKDTADSYCEFQTAFIAPENQLNDYIRKTADEFVTYYKIKAKQLAKIPDNVTSDDLVKYISTLENVPIGYNFYEKDIAKFNLLNQKIYLVTGKNIVENMNFMYGLSNILSKIPNTKVRVIDLLECFAKPILDIKLFNSNYDVVFGALEKDVINRTETNDYGINIIIGAGQIKKKLSNAGNEIALNLFNNIINSKKSIYILVDNYDKLRTLKLEPWYNMIDTSRGLWLGPGLNSQSMFTTNELSEEDKKYLFEGMAFNIENSKYNIIKTMMDGED